MCCLFYLKGATERRRSQRRAGSQRSTGSDPHLSICEAANYTETLREGGARGLRSIRWEPEEEEGEEEEEEEKGDTIESERATKLDRK